MGKDRDMNKSNYEAFIDNYYSYTKKRERR